MSVAQVLVFKKRIHVGLCDAGGVALTPAALLFAPGPGNVHQRCAGGRQGDQQGGLVLAQEGQGCQQRNAAAGAEGAAATGPCGCCIRHRRCRAAAPKRTHRCRGGIWGAGARGSKARSRWWSRPRRRLSQRSLCCPCWGLSRSVCCPCWGLSRGPCSGLIRGLCRGPTGLCWHSFRGRPATCELVAHERPATLGRQCSGSRASPPSRGWRTAGISCFRGHVLCCGRPWCGPRRRRSRCRGRCPGTAGLVGRKARSA